VLACFLLDHQKLMVSEADELYTSAGATRVRRLEFSTLNGVVGDKSRLHSKPHSLDWPVSMSDNACGC
jgi:hypothetical protein